MDPKASPKLESTLQDTYDKVMNFSVPNSSSPANSLESQQSAQHTPVTSTSHQEQTVVVNNANTSSSKAPTQQTHAFKAKNSTAFLVPFLVGLGGVLFLGVYAIIWIKIINVSIPIINP